jgi:hypothetical protein
VHQDLKRRLLRVSRVLRVLGEGATKLRTPEPDLLGPLRDAVMSAKRAQRLINELRVSLRDREVSRAAGWAERLTSAFKSGLMSAQQVSDTLSA